MTEPDREFIAPELLGHRALTAEEKRAVHKSNRGGSTDLFAAGICAVLLWVIQPLEPHFWNMLLTGLLAVFVLAGILTRLDRRIAHQGCGSGTVAEMQVQYQTVAAKDTSEWKPYQRNPEESEIRTQRRAFYYLTVKLDDGRYIRYVSCKEAEYNSMQQGDPVLVLYFGSEILRGYPLETNT